MVNKEELQQRFAAAQSANEFYAASTTWYRDGERFSSVVFLRPSWRTRVPAFSISLLGMDARYIAVERTLDDALAAATRYGYTDEVWEERDRTTYHHYIASCDSGPLWRAGYGIVRELMNEVQA